MVLSLSALSISVMADEGSVTLINKDETITTTYPVIERSGDYFIAADDLNLINIDYIDYDNGDYHYGLGQLNGPYKYTFSTETGTLEYEKVYENAVFVENDLIYVSIGALIDLYSVDEVTNIDTENDILTFWINDYKTATHWVTYQIDTLIPIDEDGMEVTLYRGFKRFGGYAKGAGGKTPELFVGKDLTDYPTETDVYNMGYLHSIKSSENHIFYANSRFYTIYYDEEANVGYRPGGTAGGNPSYGSSSTGGSSSIVGPGSSSGSSGGGASVNGYNTAGIKINNDTYIGGVYKSIDETHTVVELQLDDVIEYVSVSGSITIPSHTEDVEYSVIAQKNGNILPQTAFSYNGVFSADETTTTYELKITPNIDYELYVRFTNGDYVRQTVNLENITSDKVINFNDFVKSEEITGRIKLPSDTTSVTDVFNNSLETLYGVITLQGSEEPHYIVDREEVELVVSDGYADFVLRDDASIENGIVSFTLYNQAKEIYEAGVYYDNETVKYVAEDGTPIPTDTKNIVLNIAKGKVITIDVNCDVYSRTEMYLDIARSEEETNLENCPLYVEAMETDILYDNEEYTHTLRFTAVIPEDLTHYRPYMKDSLNLDYTTYLGDNNEWVNNIDNSGFTWSETLTTHYKGYDPATPIEVHDCGYSLEDGYCYGFYVDSLFDYEATIYIAYYGENNKLLHIESQPQTFENYENYELYFKLDSTYEPLSEEIKMYVWTDALRPLSSAVTIK